MALYTIRQGFSVRDPNNDRLVHQEGSTIELADSIAEQHKHKLELYVAPVEEDQNQSSASDPQPSVSETSIEEQTEPKEAASEKTPSSTTKKGASDGNV
ncbi:MAG: hypothetical protein V4525_11000 [Pseudomonadota bacterium]